MNILILQSSGKHAGNKKFRECLNIGRALDKIDGIDCMVYGPGYGDYKHPFKQMEKWCDVILLLENYSKEKWLPNLHRTHKLKLFWSIDSHVVLKRHIQTVKENKINIVLNSTSVYINKYKGICDKSLWFPNCYPSDLIDCMPEVGKKYDVGFCGNYLRDRKKYLDLINRKHYVKRDIFIIGEKMVWAINSYKIHFNKNHSTDVNYRTFETLGCKTFLLTNETGDLKELFTIGKHLDTYKNINECIKKIGYYLNHPHQMKAIADIGYHHVKENHTYDNRAKELIDIIKESI